MFSGFDRHLISQLGPLHQPIHSLRKALTRGTAEEPGVFVFDGLKGPSGRHRHDGTAAIPVNVKRERERERERERSYIYIYEIYHHHMYRLDNKKRKDQREYQHKTLTWLPRVRYRNAHWKGYTMCLSIQISPQKKTQRVNFEC